MDAPSVLTNYRRKSADNRSEGALRSRQRAALTLVGCPRARIPWWFVALRIPSGRLSRPGRKTDFVDAERLVKRLVANELTLSFVPDPKQRLWRTLARRKYQMRCNRVQLQNRLEALLEEAHLKLSSFVSDLLGVSARRMLRALAARADYRLRATPDPV